MLQLECSYRRARLYPGYKADFPLDYLSAGFLYLRLYLRGLGPRVVEAHRGNCTERLITVEELPSFLPFRGSAYGTTAFSWNWRVCLLKHVDGLEFPASHKNNSTFS